MDNKSLVELLGISLEDTTPTTDPGETLAPQDTTGIPSKEVDTDGNPLPEEEQQIARDYTPALSIPGQASFDLRESHVSMNAAAIQQLGLESFDMYSSVLGPDGRAPNPSNAPQPMPYCPIFVDPKPNGGKLYTAYISDKIIDVDQYIDLIDLLLIADATDTFLIYIDSPGGMVSSGGIISSAIWASKAEVYTDARGICASAGALIHSSPKEGHHRVSNMAVLMYHMSSHMDYGNSCRIAERANNQIRYVNECLLNQALEQGHITSAEFQDIQNGKEIYLNAEEFRSRMARRQQSAQPTPQQPV